MTPESEAASQPTRAGPALGLGALFTRLAAVCVLIAVGFLLVTFLLLASGLSLSWLARALHQDPMATESAIISGLARAFVATALVGAAIGGLGLRLPHGEVNWRPLAWLTVVLGVGLPLLALVVTRWVVARALAAHAPWP
jgi:hypothetical protein